MAKLDFLFNVLLCVLGCGGDFMSSLHLLVSLIACWVGERERTLFDYFLLIILC